jgi:hypothetical protein
LIALNLSIDPNQGRSRSRVRCFTGKRQTKMTMTDIEIVVLVVSAFSLFGGVLGWASWDESRRTRKAHK